MLEWLAPGLAYQVAKDVVSRLTRRKRRLTPEQIIELRSKWKPQFEEYLWKTYSKDLSLDVIIRDMKRLDAYPNVDDKGKGISPWFRMGLAATYHRGIMVGHQIGIGTLMKDGDGWRYTNYNAGEQGDEKVYLISSIPYENIEQVDWHGDEYYNYPHIYCWFNNKHEPYEYTGIYKKHEPLTEHSLPWYNVFADLKDVQRRSKRAGVRTYFG